MAGNSSGTMSTWFAAMSDVEISRAASAVSIIFFMDRMIEQTRSGRKGRRFLYAERDVGCAPSLAMKKAVALVEAQAESGSRICVLQ